MNKFNLLFFIGLLSFLTPAKAHTETQLENMEESFRFAVIGVETTEFMRYYCRELFPADTHNIDSAHFKWWLNNQESIRALHMYRTHLSADKQEELKQILKSAMADFSTSLNEKDDTQKAHVCKNTVEELVKGKRDFATLLPEITSFLAQLLIDHPENEEVIQRRDLYINCMEQGLRQKENYDTLAEKCWLASNPKDSLQP